MAVIKTRLGNGLTILAEEAHAAPVVALQAWVHAGSGDEQDENAGIAHLHEHMLFKGTATLGVGEIAKAVEACGGEINAWTSFDQTVYHLVLAAREMPVGMGILADALRTSAFDAEELAREIEVVIEEIRRAEDAPARRISKALFELAFGTHPYRRPVLGSEETVRSLNRDRVLEFYHQHYRPERITLVVVGDFEVASVVEQAESLFGDWRLTGAPSLLVRPAEPPQTEARVRLLVEDVQEARCALAWHIPEVGSQDIPAVDALSVVLGHGDSSLLNRELRRRRQLVNDIHAFAYTPREPGLMMVGAGLKQGQIQEGVEGILDQVFALRRQPVTDDDLEKAKVVILSEAAYQRETVQGQARKLGFYEVVAGAHTFEAKYLAKIKALTPDDLCRVAQLYFTETPTLVVQTATEEDVRLTGDPAHLPTLLPEVLPARFARSAPRRPVMKAGSLDVIRLQLDSGAVILVRPESSPVVAVRALVLGGQRHETAATAGLGNLFASVWGTATTGLSADAMASRVAMLGGSLSAFSGRNALGMRGEFIAERSAAGEGLRLLCDALFDPFVSDTDLERERAATLQRIKNRADNGASVAYDAFAAALFGEHPYGLKLVGEPETVESFSLDQVLSSGASLTPPGRFVVSVAGGLDAERVIDILTTRLGAAPAGEVSCSARRSGPPESRQRHRRTLDKKQAHIVVGGMGTTVDDPDRYALEVLTTVLSGQSGRLFLDLRDQRSLAYSVSCSSLEGLDPGYILVHMGTSPDKVAEGLAGIDEHLERIRQEPVSADELARAKRYLIGTHAIDLQRCGARAMVMGLGELFGLGYDNFAAYPERIDQITAEDVGRVGRRFLASERLIEVVVGPE